MTIRSYRLGKVSFSFARFLIGVVFMLVCSNLVATGILKTNKTSALLFNVYGPFLRFQRLTRPLLKRSYLTNLSLINRFIPDLTEI